MIQIMWMMVVMGANDVEDDGLCLVFDVLVMIRLMNDDAVLSQ